ncbi:polymeric immunoglobulin receptor [Danio aesculapii]|uniref:polymeric immunoglobulin receptor n=1 Tax=Danio aesculapii TaxID=1142201 RepID=UPI0024BFBB5C|nr:polymeric immunoglobulin receptor [Danio aesculapii]
MGDDAVSVTGIAGGSVILNFQYTNKMTKESAKSFCRVSDGECTKAQSHLYLPAKNFTMTEDKSVDFLSVLIRNLTINDRGMYGWKANNKWLKEVKLDVQQEPCCGRSEEQTAYELGAAVIHCRYPKTLHDYPKQLFKLQNGSLHSVFTYKGVFSPMETSDPRYSMNVDHGEEHLFTVTLINVSRHDEGLYFCAAHAVMPNSYSLIFSEIQLHVTDAPVQPDLSVIIITVSVCVILLFAAILSLLLLRQKCTNTKGSGSSDQRSTVEVDEINSSVYYSSIKEQSAQKPVSMNTVYATAQLQTVLSDSDPYTLAMKS